MHMVWTDASKSDTRKNEEWPIRFETLFETPPGSMRTHDDCILREVAAKIPLISKQVTGVPWYPVNAHTSCTIHCRVGTPVLLCVMPNSSAELTTVCCHQQRCTIQEIREQPGVDRNPHNVWRRYKCLTNCVVIQPREVCN